MLLAPSLVARVLSCRLMRPQIGYQCTKLLTWTIKLPRLHLCRDRADADVQRCKCWECKRNEGTLGCRAEDANHHKTMSPRPPNFPPGENLIYQKSQLSRPII